METITLTATQRRPQKGAAKRLRRQGFVPAVLYGHKFKNMPLQIEALPLRRALAQAGTSQLIQLKVKGVRNPYPVLVREVQRDMFTGDPIHVDLLAVSMTEKVTAEVSITLVGEPQAVSSGAGILQQGISSVEIECLPGDLVPTIEVDVSGLELNSALYVSDLPIPPGATILTDPQEMIAQVIYEEEMVEAVAEEGEVEEIEAPSFEQE